MDAADQLLRATHRPGIAARLHRVFRLTGPARARPDLGGPAPRPAPRPAGLS